MTWEGNLAGTADVFNSSCLVGTKVQQAPVPKDPLLAFAANIADSKIRSCPNTTGPLVEGLLESDGLAQLPICLGLLNLQLSLPLLSLSLRLLELCQIFFASSPRLPSS